MAELYKLSGRPLRYTRGAFVGKLQGVNFTASSSADTRQWFTNNYGQFELALSQIMPSSIARVIVAALTNGDEVDFPGRYEEAQFDRGFVFEWSPMHLVPAPESAWEGMY